MSVTTIIELNQNKADRVLNNGEYHCSLATPVTVNEGDQVGLKMASIDSKRVEQNSIVIDKDTALTMAFCYYDIDYSNVDKQVIDGSGPWGAATYDYYLAYDENATEYYQLTSLNVHVQGYQNWDAGQQYPNAGTCLGDYATDVLNNNLSSSVAFYVDLSWIDQFGKFQQGQLSGRDLELVNYGQPYNVTAWGATKDGNTGKGIINCTNIANYVPGLPKDIIFKKGTLKLTQYLGSWLGQNTLKNMTSGKDQPFGGVPAGDTQGEGSPTDIPVKSSDFSVNMTLSSEGGDINATPYTGPGGNQLYQNIVTAVIPAGVYDPVSLAVVITQKLNNSEGLKPLKSGTNNQLYAPNNPMLFRTDDPDIATKMFFRKIDFDPNTTVVGFDNGNSYFYSSGGANRQPYFVGASQFAIEYGSTGQVFNIPFMHMPLFEDGNLGAQSGQKQMVGIFHTGSDGTNDLRFHQINQSSGIIFTALEPKEFWTDILGLYDKLLTPTRIDSNGVHFICKDDFLATGNSGATGWDHITYGYASLDQFLLTPPAHTAAEPLRKMAPLTPATPNPTDPVYIDVTGLTSRVIGSQPQGNLSGGYYIVEILGLVPRAAGVIDNKQINPKINAIISIQYSTDNIVTGYSDSGIDYVHYGNPYNISEALVRILDPKTMQPVSDLGTNNTIFVQVVKTQPSQLQQMAQQAQAKAIIKQQKQQKQ